jgi:hypothetical protein
MPEDHRDTGQIDLGRRTLLHGALAAGGILGVTASLPVEVLAFQQVGGNKRVTPGSSALKLAEFLNKTRYSDLPPKAIEHAKMIIASTLAPRSAPTAGHASSWAPTRRFAPSMLRRLRVAATP